MCIYIYIYEHTTLGVSLLAFRRRSDATAPALRSERSAPGKSQAPRPNNNNNNNSSIY